MQFVCMITVHHAFSLGIRTRRSGNDNEFKYEKYPKKHKIKAKIEMSTLSGLNTVLNEEKNYINKNNVQ